MKLLRMRHDLIAINISDPAEELFPLKTPVIFEDAETGRNFIYSGKCKALNSRLQHDRMEKISVCRRAKVDLIEVRCGEDVLKPLIGFFSERQKRMRRRV